MVEKGLAKLEEDKFIITQKKRARIKPKSSEPEPDTAQEGAKKYNKYDSELNPVIDAS